MPAPFHTRYSDEAYLQNSSIKPSTGFVVKPKTPNNNGARNIQVTRRVGGAAMQASGLTAQMAGKGMKGAGKTSVRAGARLSATGIGAIVGVPLMAVGGLAQGTGVVVDAAGKQMSKAGRGMKRKGGIRKTIKGLQRGTVTVNVRAFLAGSLYALPIILMSFLEVVFLALGLATDAAFDTEIKEEDGLLSVIWKGSVGLFNSLSGAIKGLTGFDVAGLLGELHPGNFFALFYIAVFGLSMMTLMNVWAVYEFSGSKPLSGNGAGAKTAAFLTALCFYCLPVIHMLPWFLVWMMAITKYGK